MIVVCGRAAPHSGVGCPQTVIIDELGQGQPA
jgi:hypothetical protein